MNILPAYRAALRPAVWLLLGLLVVLIISLIITPPHALQHIAGYVPLHTFLETMSIVVSMLVFSVLWGAHGKRQVGSTVLLGSIFLGIALLDFVHVLSYQGMPDFVTPGSPEKSIYFWLVARFLSAFGLLVVAVSSWYRWPFSVPRWWCLATTLLLVILVAWIGLLHPDWLPRTFIAGQGLTAFKIASEYFLAFLFFASAFVFLLCMRTPQSYDVVGLFTAVSVMALSEILFTLYSEVTDIYNTLGHVYKVIAYGFICKAIFIDNIRKPYQRLQEAHDVLELQIRQRQFAERGLRVSELQFSQLLSQAPMPMVIYDAGGNIKFLNMQFTEAFGYTLEDIPTTAAWRSRAFPDKQYRAVVENQWMECLNTDTGAGNTIHPAEYLVTTKNGDIRTVEIKGSMLGDLSILILTDHTERRKLEIAIQNAIQDLATAQQISHVGSWRINLDTNALTWSEEAARIFGVEPNTPVDYDFFLGCIHPDDAEKLDSAWKQAVAGAPYDIEHRIVVGDEIKWVREQARLIFSAEGKPISAIGSVQDITERKLAREALRESEERYRRITDAITDYIYTVRVENGVAVETQHGPGCFAVTGYRESEFVRDPYLWINMVAEPDRPMVAEQAKRVLAGEDPSPIEHRLIRKNGAERWVKNTIVTYRNNQDVLIAYDGLIQDITERKLVEVALDEKNYFLNERIKELHCLNNVTALVQKGGKIDEVMRALTDFLPSAMQYSGICCTSITCLGKTYTNVCVKELVLYLTSPIMMGDSQVGSIDISYPADKLADDSKTCINEEKVLIDNIARIIGQFIQQRLSDDALKENEERLALATLCNGVGIWDWNLQTQQLIWDDSMFVLYHMRRDDFSGEVDAWEKALHPDDRDRCKQDLAAAVSDKPSLDMEFRVCWPDGDIRHIKAVAKIFRNESGEPLRVLGTNIDITESKQVREALHEAKEQLEARVVERTRELSVAQARADAANRAKSTFLANMSHELRTPMNAIMGTTAMALRRTQDTVLREQLARIDHASQHLLSVINDILDLSKIEADRLKLEQIDFRLGIVLENLLSIVGQSITEKGLALQVDVPPEISLLFLSGDPLRLGQILLNFTSNAIKFTEKGTITLRIRLAEENEQSILLRFEVQDTGIGISADGQKRIFTAFEQADDSMTRKYGGTGLGLAISKRLAQMMEGEIGVESEPGKGSTFWFTARVGRAQKVADGELSASDHAQGAAEAQLKDKFAGTPILLVEDEPVNQLVSCDMLEEVGLAVDIAEDGVAALDMVKHKEYALILMDMQMPRMNGIDATRAIRALPGYEKTPIMAMTANAFAEDRQACFDAGMNEHISKPIDQNLLYKALLKWLS